MTNEEFLELLKRAFCEKVERIDSLAEFKTFILNITPANVKAYILNKLDDRITSLNNTVSKLTSDVSDIETLKGEL